LEPSAGFGPATITLPISTDVDLNEFKQWLISREYSKSYINAVMCYASKYHYILGNNHLRDLDTLSNDIKASTVKALILLSKFLGTYTQFKQKLSEYGIKLARPDSLTAFLRILNNGNSNIIEYYNQAKSKLNPNEQTFLKFLLKSGLRTSEAIASFNMVIALSRNGKLCEYYNKDLNCLMHFKYPKTFIRRTKNCYVTFITPELLTAISQSSAVSYSAIRKRLERSKLKLRLNEFRDKFGTHLVSNGILEIEQNLCCGRLNSGIFVKHYWSPKLAELAQRIFKAVETIEADTATTAGE